MAIMKGPPDPDTPFERNPRKRGRPKATMSPEERKAASKTAPLTARQKAAAESIAQAQERKLRKRLKHPRKRTFTIEDQQVFLSLLAHGFSVVEASRRAGVSRASVSQTRTKNPEFAELYDAALRDGCDLIEHKIMDLGTKAWDERVRLRALEVMARARKPEVFGESRLRMRVDGPQPTAERLAELRRMGEAVSGEDERARAIELVAAMFADHATRVPGVTTSEPLPAAAEED